MQENTTVVRGHFKLSAEQICLMSNKSLRHRMTRYLGVDAEIDDIVVNDPLHLHWPVPVGDTGALNQWRNLGLNPCQRYQLLVPLPHADAKAQVVFSLANEHHAEDCWFATLNISQICAVIGDEGPINIFDVAQHEGDGLEVYVAPCKGGWTMTVKTGQSIDVLGFELADTITSTVMTLNHRAKAQDEFEHCASH